MAAVSAFFWPRLISAILNAKATKLVAPHPFLQIIILIFAAAIFALELPLNLISNTGIHRSIPARLIIYCLSAAATGLLYQGTNACLYTCIGMAFYVWALIKGEVLFLRFSQNCRLTIQKIIYPEPWTFPDQSVKQKNGRASTMSQRASKTGLPSQSSLSGGTAC